jgi:hypothetical protein
VSDVPPPGGYPPQQPQYPQQPAQPQYQPPPAQPQYQAPPAQPQYQAPPAQPQYQQPGQFQPVNPQASSGNGCLKAFLIVMAIGVVISIIGGIALVLVVGKAVDNVSKTFGTADAADYAVDITACTVDSTTGLLNAEGTLTNKADRKQAYNLTINFVSADNTKLGSDSLIFTGGLDKGQKYQFTATGTSSASKPPDSIQCKQGDVSYFPT